MDENESVFMETKPKLHANIGFFPPMKGKHRLAFSPVNGSLGEKAWDEFWGSISRDTKESEGKTRVSSIFIKLFKTPLDI